ncbi:MAG: hypothetical protein [Podoviridae sp. cty5g4]|nr:MAG: hypothetical protein [Podoviridae sp. cty5g4]
MSIKIKNILDIYVEVLYINNGLAREEGREREYDLECVTT